MEKKGTTEHLLIFIKIFFSNTLECHLKIFESCMVTTHLLPRNMSLGKTFESNSTMFTANHRLLVLINVIILRKPGR